MNRLRRRNAVAPLAWGLAIFLASQLALLLLCAEGWRPELGDPEYGRKLACLRARLEEQPGQRLAVALGSSRVAVGLRPGLLERSRQSSGTGPLVFNFGIMECHPVGELMYLRRLLSDEVRPDYLLIEVYPALLGLNPLIVDVTDLARVRRKDLRVLERYAARPADLRGRWWQAQLCPWSSHRVLLLNHFLPGWVPPAYRVTENWEGLDGWGWVDVPEFQGPLSPLAHARVLKDLHSHWDYELNHLRLSPTADRAYREMLDLCRERHIAAALVLLPEASAFRGWYEPSHLAEVEKGVRAWGREYGVPIIDGRTWIADVEFAEEVHLDHHGAALFTQRLQCEIARWLGGPFAFWDAGFPARSRRE